MAKQNAPGAQAGGGSTRSLPTPLIESLTDARQNTIVASLPFNHQQKALQCPPRPWGPPVRSLPTVKRVTLNARAPDLI